MDDRNDVFQRLKPVCVALSQAALALNTTSVDHREITRRVGNLEECLSEVVTNFGSLDEKLADYVFFPLSQVLKNSQNVSIRSLELTFQCLAILIARGWRARVQAPLAAQILILCTLMAEKKPAALPLAGTTSELQSRVFRTFEALFGVLDHSSVARKELVKESNIPQLGKTISTLLEGITDGPSTDCQIAATEALRSLVENVATLDINAGFLPGIVSKLTKVLTLQTKQRRHHKVLVEALNILRSLFAKILSLGLSEPGLQTASQMSTTESFSNIIDTKWLETAATQLKPAVKTIVRLRSHDRKDVKDALAQFCFVVIKDCREALSNCVPDVMETLLVLSSDAGQDSIVMRLEMAIVALPELSCQLQDMLRNWLLSLPTLMQASDEQAKTQRLKQVGIAHAILVTSGADTSLTDGMLSDALRDSVVVTLQSSKGPSRGVSDPQPIQALGIALSHTKITSTTFSLPLVAHRGQADVMAGVKHLVESMSTSSRSATFATDLTRTFRRAQGDTQLAAFWILLEHTQARLNAGKDLSGLMDVEETSSLALEEHMEDLYSFALDVLAASPQDLSDARFQSLALRALALRAEASGQDFRYELIDALYPVLHTLATPNQQLQQDSVVALNIFTKSCGYESVKDLIVDNVDYLTNTVALRLNAFDVSPRAPQVLLMMVRLAGPSLLPYLEDTVGSIFAALEDYHGYPLLVELLFQVLAVIAEEGVKAPLLSNSRQKQIDMPEINDDGRRPSTLADLADYLHDLVTEEAEWTASEHNKVEIHPQRPWTSNDEGGIDDTSEEHEDEDQEGHSDDEERPVDVPEPGPPAPKTYDLLFKISELTQHFLPSASASLRTSLLTLIKTTVPAIAHHENTFLPLINTLWPEIVSRLNDDEPQVLASTLETIALLCEYAGDFMRSRLLQVWPTLIDIHKSTLKEVPQLVQPKNDARGKSDSTELAPANANLQKAITRLRSESADFANAGTKAVWSALVGAITSAVRHASLPPDTFDVALGMMEACIEEPTVRQAFEEQNAEAVWLMLLRHGAVGLPPAKLAPNPSEAWKLASVEAH
ncbi:heat repeat protein [Zymoseptoria brevis]|uniref:Heat repeat protein n=1 Tax=Zymoseptoria brevis TaxID=1047168 RepID=A0A0F4G8S7_9PEZI|nr:heat repeat protein [Zymoseptoria brevis]